VTQLDLSQSDLQGADHPNVDSPSGTVIDFIGTTGRAEVKGNSNCIVYFKKKAIALRKPCPMNYSHQEKVWKVIGISIIPCLTPTWSYIFTVCHIW